MSRIKMAGNIISHSCKNIIFFVSDDRNIMEQIIDGNKYVFAQRLLGLVDEQRYFSGKNAYNKIAERYIEDCGYLMTPSIFSNDDGEKKQRRKCKQTACIFKYEDFHLLEEAAQGMVLKQFLDYCGTKKYLLLLSAPILSLPAGFEHIVEVIDVPVPDEEDIRNMLRTYAEDQASKKGGILAEDAFSRIDGAVGDFKGLERDEILPLLEELTESYGSFYGRSAAQRGASISDNFSQITEARRRRVMEVKRESAVKDPTITLLETGESIAGFKNYKNWLSEQRIYAFNHPEEAAKAGWRPTRGVLVTGLPGTGKTQGAKYTAAKLGVSLVQLRMDGLLGGLVGDSEKNFKRCRKRIEALAPCVVLIDEIEKLFSTQGNGNNSEVKMNLFSALLDWMQENKKGIFFYATCNSVKKLPSELLRDGRFSMRFCVFMPSYRELIDIICFHMHRIDELSGGAVFGEDPDLVRITYKDGEKIREILPTAAGEFLLSIVKSSPRPFFTGANIETLIDNVQYGLPMGRAVDKDNYVKALLSSAKSEFCQPYGMTNMRDAVSFWLDALDNTFADAGSDAHAYPLSFGRFDRVSSEFTPIGDEVNEYDKRMFEVFQKEICAAYRRRREKEDG